MKPSTPLSGLARRRSILDYAVIVIAGVFLAFGTTLFVIPNSFAPAGITGVAVMVQYKLGFSVGYLSLLINVPLCIFAFFAIDRRFAVRTAVFSVVYSVAYLLFGMADLEAWKYYAGGIDTIYPVIISGLIGGTCYGAVFRRNGSTGGTDVLSKYLAKVKPTLNFFWVNFALNACVAAASYFVYATEVDGARIYDYKPVCLCLLYCFITSFIGNKIISGSKAAYQFIIVTEDAVTIEEQIMTHLHHSATHLEGYGSYSGETKEVLLCVVNPHQLVDFENIIRENPGSFAAIQKVDFTIGNFRNVR